MEMENRDVLYNSVPLLWILTLKCEHVSGNVLKRTAMFPLTVLKNSFFKKSLKIKFYLGRARVYRQTCYYERISARSVGLTLRQGHVGLCIALPHIMLISLGI